MTKKQLSKRTPRQARALARRQKILDTTESLASAVDPDAITTTSIARGADIPVGSVYQYFENREDILGIVYKKSYDEVMATVMQSFQDMPDDISWEDEFHYILTVFWSTAKDHPTFRTMTRWHNNHNTLWAATPDIDSDFGLLVQEAIKRAGILLPEDRRIAILQTTVTTISMLIDQILEQDEEESAEQLVRELNTLIVTYISNLSS
ncbi:hypothetical protein GCM10017044_06990 [Kordiimonas sediminis]|uniref:HTH tetR-type domain-containing protein n=1 Tax=Kordiimonas sediminis TaxID=1735581 RepID=A0A919AN60_9PROT|nr:TetR/AcrR family transcriptional regulator [Kordiimonas sediminis]GHF15441.1 hypothetical protein GCM10017044_06990 [Kordiimonas sediminis]